MCYLEQGKATKAQRSLFTVGFVGPARLTESFTGALRLALLPFLQSLILDTATNQTTRDIRLRYVFFWRKVDLPVLVEGGGEAR